MITRTVFVGSAAELDVVMAEMAVDEEILVTHGNGRVFRVQRGETSYTVEEVVAAAI